MKLRAIIVDDEQTSVEHLMDGLTSRVSELIEVVGIANSVSTGIMLIKTQQPDVVFLDVQMTDGTGFSLLREFYHIPFKVIFISAYNEFAVQAFRFSALDYILKPADPYELEEAVLKARDAREKENIDLKIKTLFNNIEPSRKNPKRIVLNSLDSIEIIEVSDITRCEAKNNYTEFHFIGGKKLLISKTLKEYEKLLVPEGFFRLHASHLVNLRYIQKIDKKNGNMVLMKDDSVLPISIKRKDELLRAIESL